MKFNLLAADPPWEYEDMKKGHTIAIDYPTMTDYELMALGRHIKPLMDKNAMLALWITGPRMTDGAHIDIFKAWGFKPAGIMFVWVKTYKHRHKWPLDMDAIVRGTGHGTQGNIEICLRGIKGSLKRHSHAVPQIIVSPLGRHSEKPNHIWRNEYSRLYGNLPTLELFARSHHPSPSWITLGNELTGNPIHQDLLSLQQDIIPINSQPPLILQEEIPDITIPHNPISNPRTTQSPLPPPSPHPHRRPLTNQLNNHTPNTGTIHGT